MCMSGWHESTAMKRRYTWSCHLVQLLGMSTSSMRPMLLSFRHNVLSRRALTDTTEHDNGLTGPEKEFGAILNYLRPSATHLQVLVNNPHSSERHE
jgi:hypothetical protein